MFTTISFISILFDLFSYKNDFVTSEFNVGSVWLGRKIIFSEKSFFIENFFSRKTNFHITFSI